MNTLCTNVYIGSCLQMTRPESLNMNSNHLKILGLRSSTTELRELAPMLNRCPVGQGELAAQCGLAEDLRVAGTMTGVSGSSDLLLHLAAPGPPPIKHLMVHHFILLGVLLSLNRWSTP